MNESSQPDRDVRMRGFARRTMVADALAWLDENAAQLPEEAVPLSESAGRVLARAISSTVDVPGFDRSMMDGFALRATDSQGASASNPLTQEAIARALPGRPFEEKVGPGRAVRIMTGAPMPRGADAVLPVELVEIEAERIVAQGEVSPGKHVGPVGEDIAAGTVVLPESRRLRPQDVGVLSSIGVAEVPVVRRPMVETILRRSVAVARR